MGEKQSQPFQLSFNPSLKVDFQGSHVTSDSGLLLVRELDERLGLSSLMVEYLTDDRRGKIGLQQIPDYWREGDFTTVKSKLSKNKEHRIAPVLPGSYPPPGTSPNLRSGLLQRAVARAGRLADVVADHARLVAVEVPLTGLRVLRVAGHRVDGCRPGAAGSARGDGEHIAALGTGAQH